MTYMNENSRHTMRQFYSSRIAIRKHFSLLHSSARLFQTYVVDKVVKIQNNRLTYLCNHQTSLRVESYHGLEDYLTKVANKHANHTKQTSVCIGKKFILPSSFTDSFRYLHQRYLDAIAMGREFGKQDLFMTFTCKPKWKEITNNVSECQQVKNRLDLIDSVCRLTCKELIIDIVTSKYSAKSLPISIRSSFRSAVFYTCIFLFCMLNLKFVHLNKSTKS